MRNKKRNRIFLLLILLLGLGIGFAALATTLKINGTTTINKNTWNIYWNNIDNETGVEATTSEIVSEDANHPNNIVNFAVTFNQPGDYYEFEVDAVNAGTLDAELVSIVKKYNNTVIPEVEDPNNRVVPAYLKYEVKYADNTTPTVGDRLPKAEDLTSNPQVLTRKTYKVRVEYDRDAVTNTDINGQVGNVECSFSLEVEYGQATPVASPWDLPEGKTAETLTVGDELCIKEQCFNFVKYDSNGDAVLLAKWNLNVDGYTNAYGGTETFLQNSEVRGEWNDNGTMKDYGRVRFASEAYWYDSSLGGPGIKPKYNASNYPVDVFDMDYDGAPDTTNYSIAYYVKQYKNILESSSYGATIKEARLLTYSEAVNTLGCDSINNYESGSCPNTGSTGFVANTDYFLGTAENSYYVRRILYNTILDETVTSWHGVRPVLVIETSNL